MFNLSRLINILLLIALSAFGGAMLGACSSEKDEPQPETTSIEHSTVVHVTMTLYVGSASADSESSAETEETGTKADNYIDISNLHLYLYDGSVNSDGYLSGVSLNYELVPTVLEPVNQNNSRYHITCDIPKSLLANQSSFRVVVFANWQHNPSAIPLNAYGLGTNYLSYCAWYNGCDYEYNYGYDSEGNATYFEPSEETPIPLYGVVFVQNYSEKLSSGDTLDFGEINLFRAMAKIIVIDQDAMDSGVESDFDSVTMSRCFNRGMCMPNKVFSDDVTEITAENICTPGYDTNDYCTSADCSAYMINGVAVGLSYQSELGYIRNLPFKKINNYEYVVYVPEYQIANDKGGLSGEETQIDISAYGKKYTIEFKDYVDGQASCSAFDILRDHIYEYSVSIEKQIVPSFTDKNWNGHR